MLINVPTFKILVHNSFITNGGQQGYVEAYLVAVRCLKSRPLLFTAHLENGAVYSGLPINALCVEESEVLDIEVAQPWSCLEGPCNALIYEHLKDYQVQVMSPDLKAEGRYLFTIDYHGQGLAQDPEQHKTHNIIALNNGPLVAMPNNYLLWPDDYFQNPDSLPASSLRRTSTYYRTN